MPTPMPMPMPMLMLMPMPMPMPMLMRMPKERGVDWTRQSRQLPIQPLL